MGVCFVRGVLGGRAVCASSLRSDAFSRPNGSGVSGGDAAPDVTAADYH